MSVDCFGSLFSITWQHRPLPQFLIIVECCRKSLISRIFNWELGNFKKSDIKEDGRSLFVMHNQRLIELVMVVVTSRLYVGKWKSSFHLAR